MTDEELKTRISFVRRDIGNLLFHLTRKPGDIVNVEWGKNTLAMSDHASSVLRKIAIEGRLLGSSTWIRGGYNCICFTESPISELAAVLSLSKIAANDIQRPRYEPYGVAVTKSGFVTKVVAQISMNRIQNFKHLMKNISIDMCGTNRRTA